MFKPIHNMSRTSFYHRWIGIKQRCLDPNTTAYKNYGGRGIKVCDRWMNFDNFKTDMYESYEKHRENYGHAQTSIERIDVNGDYCPENCTWATRLEQGRNKRPGKNSLVEFRGEKKTRKEWAAELNVNIQQLTKRARKSLPLTDKNKKRIVCIYGETLTLRQAAAKYGISYKTLYNRHVDGFTDESILNARLDALALNALKYHTTGGITNERTRSCTIKRLHLTT